MECYDEFNTENDKPQRQNYTDVEDSESKDLPTNLFYKRIAPTLPKAYMVIFTFLTESSRSELSPGTVKLFDLPKADMVILRSSPKVAGRSYLLAP